MRRYFVTLGIENRWTTAVMARWSRNGGYSIEGFAHGGAAGFNDGEVTDHSEATKTLTELFAKLKRETGRMFHDVFTSVTTPSARLTSSTGTLLLSRYGREVTSSDVARCTDIASTVKLPLDEEVLHRMVGVFRIDDQDNIRNPVNLEGVKLEARANMLSVKRPVLNNIAKCISRAGYISRGFISSPLACSYRMLRSEDKESGTVLFAINDNFSEMAMFRGGGMVDFTSVPIGRKNICDGMGAVDIPLLEKVKCELDIRGEWKRAVKAVFTGGLLIPDELIESFQKVFNIPFVSGLCIARPEEELPQDRISYVKSLGMLDHLLAEKNKRSQSRLIYNTVFEKVINFIDNYF